MPKLGVVYVIGFIVTVLTPTCVIIASPGLVGTLEPIVAGVDPPTLTSIIISYLVSTVTLGRTKSCVVRLFKPIEERFSAGSS